ncbi:MAG: hydrogenase expression/formation C-terminal domain-containing protein [Wenzhouxiangellaceae bacterium]|nr:hydrogenase expression/formation C-terminal domain-containing protein [Wenzhouxiangellaceae bacterium]
MSVGIPVTLKSAPAGNTIGVGLRALVHEIAAHLDELVSTGQAHAIDLKSLPMAPQEFNELKKLLGEGEIDMTLDIDGPTRIRETAFAGVWWIQHQADNGRILAEYIEIARFPDFLSAQPEHISDAVRQLRDRLQGATP